MNLTLKKQIDNHTCTSACLAMILGMSVPRVVREFHLLNLQDKLNPKKYLLSKKVITKQHTSLDRIKLDENRLYLLSVASLNTKGGLHNVLLEVIDGQGRILDPNKGRPNKEYYIYPGQESSELAHELEQYTIDLSIKLRKENNED